MAVTFDAVTTTASTAGASTKTFSHTCTGSNGLLFVVAGCHTATADISGVTYNGVAMTQVGADQTDSANGRLTLWSLIAPTSGANNVVITATAVDTISYGAISFAGAKQTSNPDSNTAGSETATASYTVTATAPTTNEMAVLVGYAMSGAALTGGTNTTIASQPEVTYHGTFIARTTAIQAASGSLALNVTSSSQTFKGLIATIAPWVPSVNVLAIGGGGSGGGCGGGAGGAGGYQSNTAFPVTAGAYTVTVGAGGAIGSTTNGDGNVGNASTFSTITANGGGFGAGGGVSSGGGNGGSGGGGSTNHTTAGTGNQGNNGGTGTFVGSGGGSGGGGATSAGAGNAGTAGGNGGTGTSNSISGAAVTYAGGGGGGAYNGSGAAGTGGAGGGGNGSATTVGANGTDGLGGGGGGGSFDGAACQKGGKGGDGVVIIAYHTDGSDGVDPLSTGGTITTSGAFTIHTFTTSGTWTMVPTGGTVQNSTFLVFM